MYFSNVPTDGKNPFSESSAFILHSIACPCIFMSFCVKLNFSPAATLICSLIKSTPVISSEIVCST